MTDTVISKRTTSPMHTLGVMGKKLYIVGAPEYITAVSRAAKNISFTPFVSELGIRITGADKATRNVIERDLTGPRKKEGYVARIHDETITSLAPGPDLDQITRDMLSECADSLKSRDKSNVESPIPLYGFLRTLVTLSSTTAIYGPSNPFAKDASLEDSFWTFMAHLNMLLLNTMPSVIARTGYNARLRVAEAFAEYFANPNSVPKASAYAKMRHRIATQNGVDHLNMGRLESGGLIGILVNTVPSVYFLLLHVFSSPSLLAEIRKELDDNAVTNESFTGGKVTLNISSVRSHAPLLNSVYKETLRAHSENASARFIMEDTTLDGRFLLKKDSILLMPNSILHQDSKTWGDVDFQARRFVKVESDGTFEGVKGGETASKRAATVAYRPFGGGSTLCPGRHFAANEVLGLAAMIIWRYDIEATNGAELSIPEVQQQSVVEAIIPPKKDVSVRMKPRTGMDMDWTFSL